MKPMTSQTARMEPRAAALEPDRPGFEVVEYGLGPPAEIETVTAEVDAERRRDDPFPAAYAQRAHAAFLPDARAGTSSRSWDLARRRTAGAT
ncbi:MAG: hypothetical protein MZV64_12680 [Ignavibacteriales bacterium]|nr:hypothetical protein [Ignavibacteriales bacterium]